MYWHLLKRNQFVISSENNNKQQTQEDRDLWCMVFRQNAIIAGNKQRLRGSAGVEGCGGGGGGGGSERALTHSPLPALLVADTD